MAARDVSIAELIRTADAGDPTAASALFAALYGELHAIAERQLRHGGSELTLGTTTLLHEAYLNIAQREGVQFASREHFLGYAARAMRGLMIDYVRRRRAKKRGGEFHITSAGTPASPEGDEPGMVSADSLERLSAALDVLTGQRARPGAAGRPPFLRWIHLRRAGSAPRRLGAYGPPTMAERPAPAPPDEAGRLADRRASPPSRPLRPTAQRSAASRGNSGYRTCLTAFLTPGCAARPSLASSSPRTQPRRSRRAPGPSMALPGRAGSENGPG
jgi:RNA polymerase sigma factor (TIGR02999 family)